MLRCVPVELSRKYGHKTDHWNLPGKSHVRLTVTAPTMWFYFWDTMCTTLLTEGEWTHMASTWLQTCCCCYWNVCGWTLASGKRNAKVEAVLIVFHAYFIRQLTVWEGWRFTVQFENPTGVILTGTAVVIYVTISGNDNFCIIIFLFTVKMITIMMLWHLLGSVHISYIY